MSEHFDAVVVGSGFGGAIPALRIAEKGKRVLVLERGYRLKEKDFRQDWSLRNVLRLYSVIPSEDFKLQWRTANLLGGGSVIYSGASLKAPSEVFDFVDKDGYRVWPAAVDRKALGPHYDTVERMMEITQAGWDEVPKSGGTFAKLFDNMGLTADRGKYPYVNCRQCGYCEVGCIFGAKKHLGRNYIPRAEEKGAEFRDGCKVREISPSQGGYTVKFIDRYRIEREAEGGVVVLAAGAPCTAEILLRSKEGGLLPDLSDQTGRNFNNNGDFPFFFALPENGFEPFEVYKGRTNAVMISYAFWKENKITFHTGSNPPAVLALDMAKEGLKPWGLAYKHFMKEHYPWRIVGTQAIGLVTGEGEVRLANDMPVIKFPLTPELAKFQRMVLDVAKKIAAANNASLLHLPVDEPYGDAHLLGSCRMGDDPARSVTDANGEVRGYPGLFITDGSVIPGGTGVNPAHTIAANAERIAAHIVENM